jgi:SAM-dependent methyltransferase
MNTSDIPDFVRDHHVGRVRRALAFVATHGWRAVWHRARERGLLESARFIADNIWFLNAVRVNRRFDRRYHVDTCGDIPARYLEVVGENQSHGAAFLSIPAHTFERAMDLLAEDIRGFTFVDIGAGKGRAMLLAARRPFCRVIGVEYAHELAAVANRNFARYRDPAQRCHDMHCYCADAIAFELPLGPLLLYVMPSDNVMRAKLIEHIRASHAALPRKMLILSVTPPQYAAPPHMFVEAGFRHRLTRKLPFDWAAAHRFQAAIYEIG